MRKRLFAVFAAFIFVIILAEPARAASAGIEGFVTDAPVRAWVMAHDQWGSGIDGAGADEFALAPFEYGSVAGTFVQANGKPVPQARVELTDTNGNRRHETQTGTDGKYHFDRVQTGDYKLRYYWPDPYRDEQWHPGQTDPYKAGIVVVTADKQTTVDETALPIGGLVVTVTDKDSGVPISGTCLSGSGAQYFIHACTNAEGKADFGTVRAGRYRLTISATGYLFESIEEVEVRPDETSTATAALTKEAVFSVTFEDAATGAPVTDVCVDVVEADDRGVVDTSFNHLQCSYSTSTVRIGMYFPGRYKLFVYPRDGVHGSQWVGTQGGTGDVDQAKWIELTAGHTTDVRVRLDGAGSITGVKTDAISGNAVSGVCPTVTPSGPWYREPLDVECWQPDGRYTIKGLGPYDWRVQFADRDGKYAWQWSGGKTDRFDAVPVRVTAGATSTLDAKLQPAGKVTGKIIGATIPYQFVAVYAANARTDDWAGPEGFVNGAGEYTLDGLNTQKLKIVFYARHGDGDWHPRPVLVVAGRTTTGVDLRVPQG